MREGLTSKQDVKSSECFKYSYSIYNLSCSLESFLYQRVHITPYSVQTNGIFSQTCGTMKIVKKLLEADWQQVRRHTSTHTHTHTHTSDLASHLPAMCISDTRLRYVYRTPQNIALWSQDFLLWQQNSVIMWSANIVLWPQSMVLWTEQCALALDKHNP